MLKMPSEDVGAHPFPEIEVSHAPLSCSDLDGPSHRETYYGAAFRIEEDAGHGALTDGSRSTRRFAPC